jgi:hypothetical protein
LCVIDPISVAGLFAWYDIQDPSTITTSGIDVLSIDDKSPNGYTLSSPVGSIQYINSTTTNFYTKKCISFSGSGSNISSTLPSVSIPAGATMFAVYGRTGTNATLVQISTATTINAIGFSNSYSLASVNTNVFVASNGLRTQLLCSVNVGNSVIASASADNLSVYDKEINLAGLTCDTLGTSNTGSTNTIFTDLRIGLISTAASVELLELVVYDKVLSTGEYNCVLNYLKDKYSYSTWTSPDPSATPTQTPTQTPTNTITTTPTNTLTPTPTNTPAYACKTFRFTRTGGTGNYQYTYYNCAGTLQIVNGSGTGSTDECARTSPAPFFSACGVGGMVCSITDLGTTCV